MKTMSILFLGHAYQIALIIAIQKGGIMFKRATKKKLW